MTALKALETEAQVEVDRRHHNRVKLSLLGRCMFSDRRECPCQLVDISPGGAAFISPFSSEPGDRVIVYVDNIGRLEGEVARVFEGGFAMTIAASPRKRDKLADTLTWLANRHILNLPEDRRHIRRTPRRGDAVLTLQDGTSQPCRIIDMSLSGAGLSIATRPAIGSQVLLGRIAARVVRHLESGIAIEFMRMMSDVALEKTIQKDFF